MLLVVFFRYIPEDPTLRFDIELPERTVIAFVLIPLKTAEVTCWIAV